MKRTNWLKIVVLVCAFSFAADQVLAVSVGPLSFSFASSLLNGLFLLPLSIAGCAG